MRFNRVTVIDMRARLGSARYRGHGAARVVRSAAMITLMLELMLPCVLRGRGWQPAPCSNGRASLIHSGRAPVLLPLGTASTAPRGRQAGRALLSHHAPQVSDNVALVVKERVASPTQTTRVPWEAICLSKLCLDLCIYRALMLSLCSLTFLFQPDLLVQVTQIGTLASHLFHSCILVALNNTENAREIYPQIRIFNTKYQSACFLDSR
mmetsp:Transcript_48970/g.93591  ORF Transcript_48970/g.93591 Transcript_48970/m.93591 type:complete len:209 (-) Transcript_48970:281-907(-)